MAKTVIIGSGAGGGIAAMVRARAGDEVVVLERGPWWRGKHFSDDEVKFGSRGLINQDPRIHPRTARIAGTDAYRGRVLPSSQCVGGGTVHYAAMSFRFRPEDFAVLDAFGPLPGGNIANWPFAYADIEPYYTRVEYLIGVQGLDAGKTVTYRKRSGGLATPLDLGANPALPPRSLPFPMAPGAGKIDNLRFAKAAKDLGFHPYPCSLAINSATYASKILGPRDPATGEYPVVDRRPERRACEECGMCSGYGCPIDAKSSTLVTAIEAIEALPNFRLVEQAMVSAIVWEKGGETVRATGVRYQKLGEEPTVEPLGPGDRVIVAGDAIETPRLFLLSGLDAFDRSGALGRNLMTHHIPTAIGFFEDLVSSHRGVYTTHAMDDLYVISADALTGSLIGGLPADLRDGLRRVGLKGGTIAAVGPSAGDPLGFGGLIALAQTLPWGEAHIPALETAFGRQIALAMIADDVPQTQNRVTVDAATRDVYGLPVARIEYTPHARDLAALAAALPIMESILVQAGAAITAGATATPPIYPSQFQHRMGTMRMGTSPTTSVVDPHGRFWSAENLYVMDGSVMVSAGGYNPTETIQAVAWMLAERL
jgi:choline dehydrogenase-like flavoprotein